MVCFIRALVLISLFMPLPLNAQTISSPDTSNETSDIILEEIIAGFPKNFPPYYMTDEYGKHTGHAIDIMNAVARNAGLKIIYRHYDNWADTQQALKNRKIDIIPNLGITKDRLKFANFTTPYENFPVVYFVRKTASEIVNDKGIVGRTIGITEINVARTFLENRNDIKIQVYEEVSSLLLALVNKEVDIVAYPEPVFWHYAIVSGVADKIKSTGLPLKVIDRGIAVRKDTGELLAVLNRSLKSLIKTNKLNDVSQTWGNPPQKASSSDTAFLMLGIGICIFIFTYILIYKYKINKGAIHSPNSKRTLRPDDYKKFFTLVGVMTCVAFAVMSIIIFFLYNSSIKDAKAHLLEMAKSNARIMEAVAKFDIIHASGYPGGPQTATLSQIKNGFTVLSGSIEVTLGKRKGDNINFLFRQKSARPYDAAPISFTSALAEPMRKALNGESGTLIGLDYQNKMVLAAHEPVKILDIGIVLKVDMSELRAPFIRAALFSISIGLLIIMASVIIFNRLSMPILDKLAQNERRYRRLFNYAEVSIWNEDLSEVYRALNSLRSDGITDLRQYIADNRKVPYDMAKLVRVLHVNTATLKMFGVQREDQFLNQIDKTFGPNMIEVFIDELCAIWRGDETFRSEANFQTLTGKRINAIISFQIPKREASYKSVPITIVDVTELKQTKEALVRGEKQLNKAEKFANMGHWRLSVIDSELYVSDEVIRIFGHDPQKNKLTLETSLDAFHPDDKEAVQNLLTLSIETGKEFEYEKRIIRADGKVREVYGKGECEFDASGNVIALFGIFQDISNQRLLEKQVRRSHKMDAIGQLTGGIAHDFNNILGIVIGNLEILQNLVPDNHKAMGRIETGLKGARRGSDLTRKLLAFSSGEVQDSKLERVNDSLKHLDEFFSKSLTVAININYQLEDNLWLTRIDAGDLQDAILNLVLNARDAMPEGGNLTIETHNETLDKNYLIQNPQGKTGEFVLLSVSDTGCGMTTETKERVLEPFFSTKEEGKGTGLGLSMVYGFVQRSGGQMDIYSEVGEGTAIRIYLPRADEEELNKNIYLDRTGLPLGTETILVVDDEPELIEVAVSHLESLGYTTLTAADGFQALKALNETPDIHLLFSDVVMPGGINGYVLAIEALKKHPLLKVILTSGFTKKSEKFKTGNIEMHASLSENLLGKPYSKSKLAQAVRKALDED